jgi:hypothetical protein
MRWRRNLKGSLLLEVDEGNGYVPYTQSRLKQPEHKILKGSFGYSTMQACLKAGYYYEPTVDEQQQ